MLMLMPLLLGLLQGCGSRGVLLLLLGAPGQCWGRGWARAPAPRPPLAQGAGGPGSLPLRTACIALLPRPTYAPPPASSPPPPCAQGRDDIGRPLLERALAIQERALGPDHPDVLAIRDVLESE
jgi:hypothetical protein